MCLKGEADMVVLRKMEKLARKCFEGELTMPKVTFWLIGAVCLLGGIVYGLCTAPLTHGVTIGCNNGNLSGSTFEGNDAIISGCSEKSEEDEEEEA